MSTIYPDSSLAALFPRGTILWRQCNQAALAIGAIAPEPFEFEPAKNSDITVLAKISLTSPYIDEPVVIPLSTEEGATNEGILLFVEGTPPDDWTYLVVTTTSMCLRTSSARERKGAVNAKFGSGLSMADYRAFRRILREKRPSPQAPFENKVWNAREVIAGTGLTRCIIDTDGKFPMEYIHFRDHQDAEIVRKSRKDGPWKRRGARADSGTAD